MKVVATGGLVTKWVAWLVLAAATGLACGQTGGSSSTETNWLEACSTSSECGGLDCVCGVCSQSCQALRDCTRADQATRCAVPDDPDECAEGELTICLPDPSLSDGSGSGGSDTSSGGTGGVDEPRACSPDAPCAELEYCDYADDSCGANGTMGVCVPFPLDCIQGPSPQRFCNCEGQVVSCGGSDYSRAGGCELAPGDAACGDKVCDAAMEVCVALDVEDPTEEEAPYLPLYLCWPLISTQGCEGQELSCDCLSLNTACGGVAVGAEPLSCEEPSDGGVEVSCLLPAQ